MEAHAWHDGDSDGVVHECMCVCLCTTMRVKFSMCVGHVCARVCIQEPHTRIRILPDALTAVSACGVTKKKAPLCIVPSHIAGTMASLPPHI